MNRTTKNSIVWGIVIVFEAIILKLAKSMKLWGYVILPILAGFLLTEIDFDKITIPKKKRRNLK